MSGLLLARDDLGLDPVVDVLGNYLFLHQLVFTPIGTAFDDGVSSCLSDAGQLGHKFLPWRRIDVDQRGFGLRNLTNKLRRGRCEDNGEGEERCTDEMAHGSLLCPRGTSRLARCPQGYNCVQRQRLRLMIDDRWRQPLAPSAFSICGLSTASRFSGVIGPISL